MDFGPRLFLFLFFPGHHLDVHLLLHRIHVFIRICIIDFLLMGRLGIMEGSLWVTVGSHGTLTFGGLAQRAATPKRNHQNEPDEREGGLLDSFPFGDVDRIGWFQKPASRGNFCKG